MPGRKSKVNPGPFSTYKTKRLRTWRNTPSKGTKTVRKSKSKSKSQRNKTMPGPFASRHTYRAKKATKTRNTSSKKAKTVRKRKLNTITI